MLTVAFIAASGAAGSVIGPALLYSSARQELDFGCKFMATSLMAQSNAQAMRHQMRQKTMIVELVNCFT